jgi:zinc transport system permease protein
MAYFGETVAQASLIGVVLALALHLDITLGVLIVTAAVAALLILLQRQKLVPMDSLLGLTHHAALALGVIAARQIEGPSIDLMGYLFGDILFVTSTDLIWIYAGGAVVLAAVAWLWQPLLRMAVNDELARAEGVSGNWVRALFTLLLALAIAVAIKIIGILLAIAFLVVPVVAARPLSATPERMVAVTALISCISVLIGIALSMRFNAPSGPAIVLAMAVAAGLSLTFSGLRARA